MNTSTFKVRWADVDANGHLRHSAYADFCAQARVEILDHFGLDMKQMRRLGVGPILFREELKYLREIGMNEEVTVITELHWSKRDASKWSFKHQIVKADKVVACEAIVDGAWMDLRARKLGNLPEEYAQQLTTIPQAADFKWLD